MTGIRVAIVDDHRSFRESLAAVLNGRDGVSIVGAYDGADSALYGIPQDRPDVVLMDLNLPGRGGVATTAMLRDRHPEIRVLVLSMLDDDATVRAALAAGATGYLSKASGLDEVLRGIRAVHDGQLLLGAGVAKALTDANDRGRGSRQDFTSREHDVLRLLADATTTAAIADQLGIAQKTVRNLLSSIYLKLGVEDRGQAVLAARRIVGEFDRST